MVLLAILKSEYWVRRTETKGSSRQRCLTFFHLKEWRRCKYCRSYNLSNHTIIMICNNQLICETRYMREQ